MKELLAEIRWKDVWSGAVYLYGNQLAFTDKGVHLFFPLIPSGKPLLKLVSRTNYQGNRRSPDLPLLMPGQHYTLESGITVYGKGNFYLQIEFFNRQNEKIGFEIVRQSPQTFTCPEETFTYELSVMTSGCQEFLFEQLCLYQEKEEEPMRFGFPHSHTYLGTSLPQDLEFVRGLING